jgi:hypothetical protein
MAVNFKIHVFKLVNIVGRNCFSLSRYIGSSLQQANIFFIKARSFPDTPISKVEIFLSGYITCFISKAIYYFNSDVCFSIYNQYVLYPRNDSVWNLV